MSSAKIRLIRKYLILSYTDRHESLTRIARERSLMWLGRGIKPVVTINVKARVCILASIYKRTTLRNRRRRRRRRRQRKAKKAV